MVSISICNSILLKLNFKTGGILLNNLKRRVFYYIALKLRAFTHFAQEIVISKIRKCEIVLQELTMINNGEAKMEIKAS